jgi:casein kinase II subunit beta
MITSAEEEEQSWITWFCSLQGNEYFCEVERSFIEDSFNLFGIKQAFPHDFTVALATILDKAEGRLLNTSRLQ